MTDLPFGRLLEVQASCLHVWTCFRRSKIDGIQCSYLSPIISKKESILDSYHFVTEPIRFVLSIPHERVRRA